MFWLLFLPIQVHDVILKYIKGWTSSEHAPPPTTLTTPITTTTTIATTTTSTITTSMEKYPITLSFYEILILKTMLLLIAVYTLVLVVWIIYRTCFRENNKQDNQTTEQHNTVLRELIYTKINQKTYQLRLIPRQNFSLYLFEFADALTKHTT